jgi:hypothetical protein
MIHIFLGNRTLGKDVAILQRRWRIGVRIADGPGQAFGCVLPVVRTFYMLGYTAAIDFAPPVQQITDA